MAKTCCCIRRAGNNCMTKNQPITILVLLSESLDITIWVLDRIINFSCIKKLTRVIICLLSANQAFSLRKVSDITSQRKFDKNNSWRSWLRHQDTFNHAILCAHWGALIIWWKHKDRPVISKIKIPLTRWVYKFYMMYSGIEWSSRTIPIDRR